MPATRDIVRRIKSVRNTKKITRAMELVSASKMKKAVDAVLATRSYANLSWLTVANVRRVAHQDQALHELLAPRSEIQRVGVVLISSNRGLCGGFNANVVQKAIAATHTDPGATYEFILMGKKGATVTQRYGQTVVADFAKDDLVSQVAQAVPITKMVIEKYLSREYDKVVVVYTDFVSSLTQVPLVKQLLPIDVTHIEEHLGSIGRAAESGGSREVMTAKEKKYFGPQQEYLFEPSPREVLDEMIPRLIEIQMYQAMLESTASEHSARMMAMRNASDAADEMIHELTLFYNKARQTAITTEISEIVGGAVALQES